jgi:hypothetical protein
MKIVNVFNSRTKCAEKRKNFEIDLLLTLFLVALLENQWLLKYIILSRDDYGFGFVLSLALSCGRFGRSNCFGIIYLLDNCGFFFYPQANRNRVK